MTLTSLTERLCIVIICVLYLPDNITGMYAFIWLRSYWPCTFLHVLSTLVITPALLAGYHIIYGLLFCSYHIRNLLTPTVPSASRSIIYPDYVTMEGETHLKRLLEQFSLKANFYDNGISIVFRKVWLFTSWIEFRFPLKYIEKQRKCASTIVVNSNFGVVCGDVVGTPMAGVYNRERETVPAGVIVGCTDSARNAEQSATPLSNNNTSELPKDR